jgi:predicted AAA+ superfamily ATPase
VPLSAEERQFLKGIYQELQNRPLEPGDPRYQPVYSHHPGCEDPIDQLLKRIDYAETESLSLFSGFRGSGKTTELFRLKKNLKDLGYTVLYADALDYVNPASPIEI